MKLFKSYLTKWLPLGEFTHATTQSIVMVRGNTKTGELFFRVKKINSQWAGFNYPIGLLGIDVKEQWKKITEAVDPHQ